MLRSPGESGAYDVVYVGHVCTDELRIAGQPSTVRAGSAFLCGAAVAGRLGLRAAAVTRMNPKDDALVQPLRELGVDVWVSPAPLTTRARVDHLTANVDERRLYVMDDAGPFSATDIPAGVRGRIWHLAGISDHEFSLPFLEAMKSGGRCLSLDLQSFVRVIGPDREIRFSDVPEKRAIVACLDVVKLDVVEAGILTGRRDLAGAAREIAGWGAREVLITDQAGVTLAADGRVYQAAFTNRTQAGRTGRGDTTISAYLCRRGTHSPEESLRFAAALVSIKLETPGPFCGTLAEVEARLAGA